MGTYLLCLRKLWPLLATLFSLTVVIINVVCFQMGLTRVEFTRTTNKVQGEFNMDREREGIKVQTSESDPAMIKVVDSLSEISEDHFSQSLQLKNLKIFVYNLPSIYNTEQVKLNAQNPPKIWDPNCTTNFYSAEHSLHHFLLKNRYRTLDPWEADFFYVPVYSCCYLINNHPNNLTKTGIFHKKLFNHIRTKYPYFNISQGRDHIWSFTQGFGAKLFGDWRLIKNGIFLVHNGQFTLDEFTPYKDLTIPPDLSGYNFTPVYKLPLSERPKKKWLGHFGGTVLPLNLTDERGSHYSKGVRQYIKEHFSKDPDFRITGTRIKTYVHDMMSSKFCLCPEGWHAWNPRPYQAVMLGCIPVLLSEEIELAFEEVIDYSRFMIRVRPADVSNLKSILKNIPKHEIKAKQREMERIWHLFSYGPDGLAPVVILKMLARRKAPKHIQRMYLPSGL